jgi:signal transduction histidine kinase
VVLLVMDHRKKVRTEALEKHEQELEQYAQELEDKVKERTTELRSEKEKLDTIVSAIGGGIVLIDDKGKIQWTNETMREMAGQDIVGKSCEDICFDCDISGSYTNEDVETTVVTNLFGLKHKHFQITTAAIKGNAGEMHGYIRLVQDVTEMKKMEDQITHSEKLASIGRLVAGIAHEIGNPLTSIFSFVQILRDMENDDFKKESLDTIYFHINRISEILKQLTGFTKAPVKGKEGPCNINDVINTSIRLIQYDKKAKNIQIESDLKDSLPEIIADENQLAQVFVNLTLNAIDAMPDGGTLRVRSRKNNGTISIEFEDEGTGIPDEDLSRIFDPFFTTKEKGTGLGLSVSFGIVKKMGGTLRAQRRPEKGTIFSIDLPVNN